MYHTNTNENIVGVALLIPDRADWKAKKFIKDKKKGII